MSRSRVSRFVISVAVGAVIIVCLFDVSVDPHFALPAKSQQPDPAREQLFSACIDRRDHEIHQRAFAMIDNPDVQREFISTERDAAAVTCRERYPVLLQTVRTPLRVKLLDFRFRYGD